MNEILIPDTLIKEVEKLISDDAVKRDYGYKSVYDFIIQAVKGEIEADKDTVGIPPD